jgi:RimJ/RimL family protein N-acetyltransferase
MDADTVFETERLLLRPLRLEDAEEIHLFTGDAKVMRFKNCGALSYTATLDGLRRNLETRFPAMLPLGFRGVVLKDCGKLIGDCGLHRLGNVEGEPVEITYTIARAFWNHGYATEAAASLIAHGLVDLGLREIVAAINPENIASARVAEKLGLTPCRKIEWPEQGLVDLYAIMTDEYRERSQRGPGSQGALLKTSGDSPSEENRPWR